MRSPLVLTPGFPLAALALAVCAGCMQGTPTTAGGCGLLVTMYGLTPGWGALPVTLEQVPSGGTLCGTETVDGGAVQATIVLASMSSSDLVAFYTPWMQDAGCTLDASTLEFTCGAARGQLHSFVAGTTPTVGSPPGQAPSAEPFVEIDYAPAP